MLKKLEILFLILLVAGSCTRPASIMSPSEMEDFLADMYLMEGALDQEIPGADRIDSADYPYYTILLEKHGVTQAIFDSSLVWYVKNPKQFKRIYVNVSRELEKYKAREIAAIDLKDSLEKVNKVRSYSLWKAASHYEIKSDSLLPLNFCIVDTDLCAYDRYVMKYKMRFSSRDSLVDLLSVFKLYYADGGVDSLGWITPADSSLRAYKFIIHADADRRVDSLAADLCTLQMDSVLLSDSLRRESMKFSIVLDSIRLRREYQLKYAKK